jgi:hypothetical protein
MKKEDDEKKRREEIRKKWVDYGRMWTLYQEFKIDISKKEEAKK